MVKDWNLIYMKGPVFLINASHEIALRPFTVLQLTEWCHVKFPTLLTPGCNAQGHHLVSPGKWLKINIPSDFYKRAQHSFHGPLA